jgi:hypothetical protein
VRYAAAAAALVLGVAASAVAAPEPPYRPDPAASTDPAWLAAVVTWQAAEATPAARAASPRWELAGRAFDAIASADAALAASFAWDHAIAGTPHAVSHADEDRPEALDEHEHHVVAAVDRFFTLAGAQAADARAVHARFLRARTWWRRGHADEADADFEDLVAHHPGADVAPYAAEMLLDSLDRRQRFDELAAWTDRAAASQALVRQDPELEKTLVHIQVAFARRAAETAGSAEHYASCAALYDRAYALAPRDDRADELVYNAAVCFELAGEGTLALARLHALVAAAPRGVLAVNAEIRIERIAREIGDFTGALAAANSLIAPGSQAASAPLRDAFADAIELHAALGDATAADRALVLARQRLPADEAHWAEVGLSLARARLAGGDRAGAAHVFELALRWARAQLPVARLAWELACPSAETDGLCLAGDAPRARDPRLVAVALAAAQAAPGPLEHARVLAAAATEAALAASPADPVRDREAATALAPLAMLADPEVALAAHAGLARLARHAGDAATERAELTACRDRALDALRLTWLTSCERTLGPPPHERVPAPETAVPPPEPEDAAPGE